MMVLVTYDVTTMTTAGRRRLRHVAKICEDYGQRVQNSVFECLVDPGQWAEFRGKLVNAVDDAQDSLRFYFLGANWRSKMEHVGAKPSFDLEGPLIL
ncbi:MAG: CRISPR-associated endonuclease Cas2 [Candidatus Ozemobacteraceae bacterium]